MHVSYGVVWREGAAPLARGKLELLPRALRLTGVAGSAEVTREIRYAELGGVRIGRSGCDRLNGITSLILEPARGERISLTAFAQPGVLGELAERIVGLKPV